MNLSHKFLLIWCFAVCHSITPPSRIVELGEVPYFVLVQGNLNGLPMICGAVLIREDVVLTNAGCADMMKDIATLKFGHDRKNKFFLQQRRIQKVLVHPDFKIIKRHESQNDIGLILLDKPVKISEFVRPIKIGTIDPDLENGTLYGYGSFDYFDPFNDYSKDLREKSVKIIDGNVCQEMLNSMEWNVTIQNTNICTEKGACRGDMGDPLVQKKVVGEILEDQIVAIVLWNAGNLSCNESPVVLIEVAPYLDWINDGVEQLRADA